jgi:biofilm PGA synthesis N-glycosyltransferase PgaC
MRFVFWGAAALIAYTYVGYAGWLWLRGHWRQRPVRQAPCSPVVSIVMVVRNEELVLERKLENLLTLDYPAELTQLIVVSDGSIDRTEAILRSYAANPRVNVVLNQLPRGKACGLNDAAELAHGDVVIFTDARQKIEPTALALLLENFADPQVGCVSGQLMLGDPDTGEIRKGVGLYWRIEKQIRQLEAASGSLVGASGALYAVRRNLLAPLPPEVILDDVHLPMQVARQGARVVFDPRAKVWDNPDLGSGQEFARKVRTLTGNYQLLQVAPWLLSSENPIRFEFLSHKLLRLVAPFALAALFLASMLVSGSVYKVALVLQLAFYALGLLGVLQLRRGPIARLADAALTFVVLNTAALVAFANFITGRKAVWAR